MKKQQGIVLFFSLIVLIIMTVIGVALAVNSTQSLRMAGAGAERIEAKAVADGGLAQVIDNYSGAPFANLLDVTDEAEFEATQKLTPLPEGAVKDVACQRTSRASGANLISCRRVQITSTVSYGRGGLGSLTVASGVEQQVLP
ncbi:PilX N-terminal domain-containing pilus assembly protein [Shewanella sp. 10N.286.51.B2]|uniref:pilus assembly PilX family protein n=1 Tax=unclassified Shewanella TaxID=196818 RepID=UPI00354B17FA